MKRTTLSIIAWVLLTLVLAACAAQPTAEPTSPPATQAPPAATATLAAAYPAAEATTDPAAYPAPDATTSPDAYPDPGSAGEVIVSGDWIQFTLVPDQSEARYLITEQLAGRDLPNDVIGKTNQVAGVVYVSPAGSIDPARSKFVIQAGSLATDESRRDNYVRSNTLQTTQYPEIVFVPTAVSGLTDPLGASGEVSFILTGQLTIRDVTKEVTWEVTGTINGDTATGTAKTALKFADFNLTQPRVPIVLSVEDNIRLEMDVVLQRVGN